MKINREEKRKYTKKLRSKGFDISAIEKLIKLQEMPVNRTYLQEGQKVNLDIEKIKSHPDWDKLTDKYKTWVELHKNDTFTVEYDEKHRDNPILVCFEEDNSVPKWLFYEGDLVEVKVNER